MSRNPWPSREEWAAEAEHAVRTRCFPAERVSSRPGDYLAPEELTGLYRVADATLRESRRAMNAASRVLAALFRDEPKTAAARYAWAGQLDGERGRRYEELQRLRSDRAQLNDGHRRARGKHATVDDIAHGLHDALRAAGRHLATPTSVLLRALVTQLTDRRDAAAHQALDDAIRAEVAKRNSDEGWAKELERRSRFEQQHTLHPHPAGGLR